MSTMDSNVDAVWESMKAGTDLSFIKHDTLNSFDALCLSKKNKKTSNAKIKKRRIKGENQSKRNKNSSTRKERSTLEPDENDRNCYSSVENIPITDLSSSILLWVKEVETVPIVAVDSDDDSDDNDVNSNLLQSSTSSYNQVTHTPRFVSMLQCDNSKKKIETLSALLTAIKKLLSELPTPQELNFPPPLDPSRIVLTHKQGALVSDMASGSHVPQWAQWKRTHSSLSSQFSKLDEIHKNSEQPFSGVPSQSSSISTSFAENDARSQLQNILDTCGNPLFRRFGDKSEKCRELALECIKHLCLGVLDMGRHIAYLIPALLSRYPQMFYDGEMEVFVHDIEEHERYKRGGATERQDRSGLLMRAHNVDIVETSEEGRLSLCRVIYALIRGSIERRSIGMLDPYLSDIIIALQSHLRDPFPILKVEASHLMVQVLRIPQWEEGVKCFATAIARMAIPNIRHRNTKVRLAALEVFEASVSIPDRAKMKGAGTSAIVDMVGFREENVLPIAAFYDSKCGVTVNCLAELVVDRNPLVRARCCSMLSFFSVCLPDRYDHQQRLLPYLLSFYHDDVPHIRSMAVSAVENCGEQFEAEHPDDIIERRQYGVDGNPHCNHKAPLPDPFESRPRLGARLFVRGNTKRFFKALLMELSNWISKTRERSAELIQNLVIYCEEHLTMDFHQTLPLVVKGLIVARSEEDPQMRKRLINKILNIFELMGRYVDPDTYIPLCLPRITGDISSTTTFSAGGSQSESSRAAYASALASMERGSMVSRLLIHSIKVISVLSSKECIGEYVGTSAKLECMRALVTFLKRVKGGNSAKFGRLTDLNAILSSCVTSLRAAISSDCCQEVTELATSGLAMFS